GDAISAPRVHHQWLPDEVVVEPNFPPAKVRALTALGHKVRSGPLFGSAHSIAIAREAMTGAADLRARGAAAAGDWISLQFPAAPPCAGRQYDARHPWGLCRREYVCSFQL